MLPSVMLPKLTDEGVIESCPGNDPVPASAMARFGAVDVIATLPLALPAVCGVKDTVKAILCAGFKATGRLIPLTAKPVPMGVICETVTADPPELVSVSVRDEVLPVVTVPKLRLAGADASWPAATPVPPTVRLATTAAAS